MRWFNDENKNTKFFHANVNGRRKRLNIDEIYLYRRGGYYQYKGEY